MCVCINIYIYIYINVNIDLNIVKIVSDVTFDFDKRVYMQKVHVRVMVLTNGSICRRSMYV